MSIYSRLPYNFTPANSEILVLSDSTKSHLNSMPRLLSDWQIDDISDSNVGGYFKNPVGNLANTLIVNTSIIQAISNTVNPSIKTLWGDKHIAAQNLSNSANSLLVESLLFESHTSNVSGVNSINSGGDDAVDFPYYDTAMGFGKLMIYLTHESDGVLNTTPTIGSMTSLFIEEELTSNVNIINTDLASINSSFSGGFYTLSNSEINVIATHIETANNLIATRRNHDILFFREAKSIITDYGTVNKFSNMGETQTKITTQYVGSDKLKQRLANT